MTVQIAVRLPDGMVDALDALVRRGEAPSRASIVSSALERELRRRLAEADAVRLAEVGAEDDLDPLVSWSAAHVEIDG